MGFLKLRGQKDSKLSSSKKTRDVVGQSITRLLKNVLAGRESGDFQQTLAETLMVLILNVDKPNLVSKCRPISLCNVLFKLITKH